MNTEVMIMFAVETVILIATIALTAWSFYKRYKGKETLNANEIIQLSKELFEFANDTYGTITKFSELHPSNFESEEAFKEALIKRIIEDANELADADESGMVNKLLYNKLSQQDKMILVANIIEKIPSVSTISDNGSTGDVSAEEKSGDEADADPAYDVVDIGDHLL